MATRPVLVCDRCGREDGVVTYSIEYPDGQWEADLCVPHSKPFRDYRENGWGRVPSKRTQRRTFEVTDLSQLARDKRPRKKP